MISEKVNIAVIRGDGIGVDVINATIAVIDAATKKCGAPLLTYVNVAAGASYFLESGRDIEKDGEQTARDADAILLGAIGMPSIRHSDGTEISPHLRLREELQLYAGVRPIKAYPNVPQKLLDPSAANIDLVILRESTEGLFYSAAVHHRSEIVDDTEIRETLRITRSTSEKLHDFAFKLARKRKARGKPGHVTCVDKANVFNAMAFFRKIFDERSSRFPDIGRGYNYVDAQALDLVRRPWEFDVLVMENMFGDILSDLGGALVGGMGMAPCAEIGDHHGLFQPAHGSAPDIMGEDKANPLAAILSGSLMLDYLGDRMDRPALSDAAMLVDDAVSQGFAAQRIRPMEFGGDMGTKSVAREIVSIISN